MILQGTYLSGVCLHAGLMPHTTTRPTKNWPCNSLVFRKKMGLILRDSKQFGNLQENFQFPHKTLEPFIFLQPGLGHLIRIEWGQQHVDTGQTDSLTLMHGGENEIECRRSLWKVMNNKKQMFWLFFLIRSVTDALWWCAVIRPYAGFQLRPNLQNSVLDPTCHSYH